jgi:hypothetical protein
MHPLPCFHALDLDPYPASCTSPLCTPPPLPRRSLERLSSVPAGNVLALSGLETSILKSATLSSSPACLPLAPMTFQAAPIVRVALEPSCPTDMAALAAGLKLLNRWGGDVGDVIFAVRGCESGVAGSS